MRKHIYLCIGTISLLAAPLQAQDDGLDITSPTLRDLSARLELGEPSAINDFWSRVEVRQTPLLEEIPGETDRLLVTFLYRDSLAAGVRLQSNINAMLIDGLATDFDQLGQMRRLGESDVWYVSMPVPLKARAPYIFQVTSGDEEKAALDPLNPLRLWPQSRFAWSVVELPGVEPQPWVAERDETPHGEWTELAVHSDVLDGAQEVWVFTPADYDRSRAEPYDVLIGLQVSTFRYGLSTEITLDNLIAAGKIPSTVAIAVEMGGRQVEKEAYGPTVTFIADELLPTLRDQFNLSSDPNHVTVAGTSRRGLVATYAAFSRPDAVRNVIAMSSSYYWAPPGDPEPEWLARLYSSGNKVPARLYVSAGTLETVVTPGNRGHYMLAMNRHFRDVLTARGYDFQFEEFGGVHHELSWQGELAKGLIFVRGIQ